MPVADQAAETPDPVAILGSLRRARRVRVLAAAAVALACVSALHLWFDNVVLTATVAAFVTLIFAGALAVRVATTSRALAASSVSQRDVAGHVVWELEQELSARSSVSGAVIRLAAHALVISAVLIECASTPRGELSNNWAFFGGVLTLVALADLLDVLVVRRRDLRRARRWLAELRRLPE